MYDLKDTRWIKNVKQIRKTVKKVVLTFDDGPSRHLNDILDILKDKNVQAIFFWQSRLLYKERSWKRVIDEGHRIGVHGHNHKNLTKLKYEQQYKEIKTSVDHIKEITEVNVQYFRPPFGRYNMDTMFILKDLNLVPVMWEITSYDWENKADPEQIICNVATHIMDGSIILLHELEQTVAILPQLIDSIREKGFGFTLL